MTEAWFRNPLTYIRECAELMVPNIAWDRGMLRRNRVDPQRHLELHYTPLVPYRILLVGDQGTAELRRGHSIENPYAVYPTWEYGVDPMHDLEDMLRTPRLPAGEYPDEIGVAGQEHRVVIIRPPNANTSLGESFIRALRDLQFEYPKAIVHYHGTYSYRVAFGQRFAAADVDPVADAAKGRVRLANGLAVPYEEADAHRGWVNMLGYSVTDLEVARNRTMFNIRSAQWAAQNFDSMDLWRAKPAKSESKTPPKARNARHTAKDGDKLLCDRCSLAPSCKHAREGGVCVLSDSETSALAKYFKTRDSGQIIDGLGRLMEKQIERAERGLELEKTAAELDPEVTKILKHVFDGGVKLAKLVDPNLAGGTKVGVFINGGPAGAVGGPATPTNALVAQVVAELEAKGVAREDIDAEMVGQYIANLNRPAIEVTARP